MRILPFLLLTASLAAAAPHQKRIYVPASASAHLRRATLDQLMDYDMNRAIPPSEHTQEKRDAYRGEYVPGPAGGGRTRGAAAKHKRAMPPGAGSNPRLLSQQDQVDLRLGKKIERRAVEDENEYEVDESVGGLSPPMAKRGREEDENGYEVDEPVGGLSPPKAKRGREEDENGYEVDEPVGGLNPPKAKA